jgi:hypothetical protein
VEIKMTNEIMVNNKQGNYEIIQNEEGKFSRKAKFEDFCSVVAESTEDKIALFNLLEGGDDESTNGLKEHVGKQIEVKDIIFRSYDKVNEDTGVIEYGVLSYLIAPDGVPYVTSSKSVYFTLKNMFKVFGNPTSENWKNIIIQVVQKKGLQHKYIDVKIVGLAKEEE